MADLVDLATSQGARGSGAAPQQAGAGGSRGASLQDLFAKQKVRRGCSGAMWLLGVAGWSARVCVCACVRAVACGCKVARWAEAVCWPAGDA